MKIWSTQNISLNLGRFPYDELDPSLQAWNGADTYLLEYSSDLTQGAQKRVLVLNDGFGALACALVKGGHRVHSYTDSFVSQTACIKNLRANELDQSHVTFINFEELAKSGLPSFDFVLMHIPKSKGYFEFQTQWLASVLPFGTHVIVGGMTKDIHSSSLEIYASNIGPSKTTLAAHKARLIVGKLERRSVFEQQPMELSVTIEGIGPLVFKNFPGVFSATSVDEASLLLANYMLSRVTLAEESTIIDCGCGNGLLALVAARLCKNAHIICTDDSSLALASAKLGFEANGLAGQVTFAWTDCLDGVEARADLIVCNPPFHQGQSQTLAIAYRMFEQAAALLTPEGTCLVVANRHLGHDVNLKKYFGRVEIVSKTTKFVVIKANI